MRTKDIIVGEDYAYARFVYDEKRGCQRVKVLGVGVERKARSWDGWPRTVHDGIHIRFLTDDGEQTTIGVRKSVVTYPAAIKRPWSEQASINAAEKRRQAEIGARIKTDRQAVDDALALAKEAFPDMDIHHTQVGRVSIDANDFQRLVQLAREA